MSDILELAKKLKRISETGQGGEKTNAAQHLERMIKKHGISMRDLEENRTEKRWIKYKNDIDKGLVIQCMLSCFSEDVSMWGNSLKEVGCEMTEFQYIEALEKVSFYRADFKAQTKLFFQAYVQKNRLFVQQSSTLREYKELTEEEEERNEKMRAMMEGIDRVMPTRKLKG